MSNKIKAILESLIIFIFLAVFVPSTFAYTTNMNASVVLGQPNFTSNSSGTSATSFSAPRGIKICNGKLLLVDMNNNRVLVWNTIPTSNGTPADVVIGQPDMNTGSANTGGRSAATLSAPWAVACAGNKVFISDSSNNRLLIYNNIPTTNGASADVVVGQTSFTTASTGSTMSTVNGMSGVASDGTKLALLDLNNRRVLIFNTIPTTNGASADVVVGQPRACNAVGLGVQSIGLEMAQGKLIVGDTFGNGSDGSRVLIWNTIPTTNNPAADVVVGQPNFTTCNNSNNGAIGANTLSQPFGVFIDPLGRLLVADRSNARMLIYNSVPTVNNTYASVAIGQPNFTSNSANQGGTTGANTLSGVREVAATDSQIFVSDGDNHRVLIFNNTVSNPDLMLNLPPEQLSNSNSLQFTGNVSASPSYTISSVQYSINGGSFMGASPTDNTLSLPNGSPAPFSFSFDPTINQPKDQNNNLIPGYTVSVKAIDNNLDVTDNLFYFQPFSLNTPLNQAISNTAYPAFSFNVNQQRQNMDANLANYQIQIKPGGINSSAPWQVLIDNIPIDFSAVQSNSSNLRAAQYLNLPIALNYPESGNGVYETNNFIATYSNNSSTISVYSKTTPVLTSLVWKAVSIDQSGHSQDSSTINTLIVGNSVLQSTQPLNYFPLSILNISGIGNPQISTLNPALIKPSYKTNSKDPIFYGIAYAGATVNLSLTDVSCDPLTSQTSCIKNYSTVANVESRFGINVPKGDLQSGRTYQAVMTVNLNSDFNQLPSFNLVIR